MGVQALFSAVYCFPDNTVQVFKLPILKASEAHFIVAAQVSHSL